MWIGLLIILAMGGVIALGQWWVTRPTTNGVVDTKASRARMEGKHGKLDANLSTRSLP